MFNVSKSRFTNTSIFSLLIGANILSKVFCLAIFTLAKHKLKQKHSEIQKKSKAKQNKIKAKERIKLEKIGAKGL
jgi:hypothetical protein